jgi:hypothetical protein
MMKRLSESNILKFLKENIVPVEDDIYGSKFKASVYLTDGTYIPCVNFRSSAKIVAIAIKSFKEKKSVNSYNRIKSFVSAGNRLDCFSIAEVEKSKFAFHASIQKQIQGETSMGWTGFVIKMKDGKYFSFGTNLSFDFFCMPDNYSGYDAQEVINHSYVSKEGNICSLKSQISVEEKEYYNDTVYRECNSFECFIDGL